MAVVADALRLCMAGPCAPRARGRGGRLIAWWRANARARLVPGLDVARAHLPFVWHWLQPDGRSPSDCGDSAPVDRAGLRGPECRDDRARVRPVSARGHEPFRAVP